MKALKDLTKSELLTFIQNNCSAGDPHIITHDINIYEEAAECVSCGNTPNTKFYYICDKCEEAIRQDGD